jgi:tetratricopeptide (TPR) repeat protein
VAPEVPAPDEFTDLLAWIHRLRSQLTALEATKEPADLARLRRGLAMILAERGFYREAETALVAALATGAVNAAHTFADSLYLAELRLETGRVDEAAELARALDPERQVPAHRLRLATILWKSGFPQLAITHIESMMQVLDPTQLAEARLLKGRCFWDLGRSEDALQIARTLMGDEAASEKVAVAARILGADCLFALGRMSESERLYREVIDSDLGPNEAAWTRLQLGHLARRAGRLNEALALYRTSLEVSPNTHYAAQAQWFLRVADRMKQAEARQAEWERG